MGDKTEVLGPTRCIYYDEVVNVLAAHPLKLGGELLESRGLIRSLTIQRLVLDRSMVGQFESQSLFSGPITSI